MRIKSKIKTDAMRKAILAATASALGPMYDPSKEDEYVQLFIDHFLHPVKCAFQETDWSKAKIVNGLRRRLK